MAQYLYVIDTSIVNGSGVAVGQTTYDLLTQERLNHGVIPIENGFAGTWFNTNDNVGIYTTKKVAIGTDSLLAQLTVQGDVRISGVTSSLTYTTSGTSSGSDGSSSTITVDASSTQMYSHIASFDSSGSTTTFQVSNLSVGRQVFLYIRNISNLYSRTIAITASTTTSGYSSINMSRSGGASVTSFSEGSGGTATVWIANIGGNLVGSLS
jgi:hypothetical protein